MSSEQHTSNTIPSIIPPESIKNTARVRSVFSADVRKLGKHRIDKDTSSLIHDVTDIKDRRRQSSSQLIDDLISRPIDPMFEDSTLTAMRISPSRRIVTQIISFLLCIIVGFTGTQVVRNLQGRSREKVRAALAAQVSDVAKNAKKLESDISQQRSSLTQLTNKSRKEAENLSSVYTTNIMNAQSKVAGDGITVTLRNPTISSSAQNTLQGRVTDGQSQTNVTDAQLQLIISYLWAGGAEAISVNDLRLGPQTSVRSAGGTVLVGVTGIQSPYIIKAIGHRDTLKGAITSNIDIKGLFTGRGIDFAVENSTNLQLPAASTVDTQYAKRKEN
ncbi:DUF881 domain-containing protein [Alloscardovia venturai]|uniref:DUF881 domain-containing protein n=1 Tax=Alloscardovia venturai TaxID=1769421 RepID=A0ABW2Y424_9BIFI